MFRCFLYYEGIKKTMLLLVMKISKSITSGGDPGIHWKKKTSITHFLNKCTSNFLYFCDKNELKNVPESGLLGF